MIEAFVQAGGRSARMGRLKALLPLGGRPCVQWVIAAARAVTPQVTVITSHRRLRAFCRREGIAVASDVYRGVGPLAGLHAALSRCRGQHALILACDLPFLTGELLHELLAAYEEGTALIPLDARGQPQPLCAVYPVACLPLVTEMIESGERRLSGLWERLTVRFLPFAEIAHLPGADDFFWDLDTPEDYRRARRRFQLHAPLSALPRA